jgi:hypothetical protein
MNFIMALWSANANQLSQVHLAETLRIILKSLFKI